MIKYIGSKRTLVARIVDIVRRVHGAGTVLDLFSGTSRVGYALKAAGYRVVANDHNAYAATIARCYVQSDAEKVQARATRILKELNDLPGKPGYFTEVFCEKARYFQPKNGCRIDAIREAIVKMSLEPELESVVLTSLMEAADRVDSTTGLQMAYLKQWAARSNNDLDLRVPELLPRPKHGKCSAVQMDAIQAAANIECDVAYLDPPYNQHSYLGNYHIWESLVLWDKPEVYGVACKRVDVRERPSVFNSRPKFAGAIQQTLDSLRAPAIVLSFNNEGYISREEIDRMLRRLWSGTAIVDVLECDFKRYVGAQIGIYDPQGQKVGTVSHLRNKEYVFLATDPARVNLDVGSVVPEGGQLSLFS